MIHNQSEPAAEGAEKRGFDLPAPVRYGVLGILLMVLITMQSGRSERLSGVIMAVIAVICLFGTAPRRLLKGRVSLATVAVFLYFLANCAAGLYSRVGNIAAVEFGKILCAFGVYVLVVARTRRNEVPHLAAMAAAVSAVIGLLSIDASSWGRLAGGYLSFADQFLGCHFLGQSLGYEAGIRITGILGNPNVLAGFLAIGIFFSLYLMRAAQTGRGRFGAAVLLSVNAVSFLLAFSMGAIGMFIPAALLYLLAEAKGKRATLFLLMAETAVVTLIMTFLAFSRLGTDSVLPDLAALGGGVLLWAVHEFGGLRLSAILSANGKRTGIAVGAVAAALGLYLVLALNISGEITLAPGETLRRSAYPEPGVYGLSATWNGDVSLTVETQSRTDTIMHTSTVLYSGPIDTVSFMVPEDSTVVWFNLRTEGGAELDRLALTDGPAVKLGYPLLPGFAANRLQGMRANQNAIQRVAFFEDGLKLFAQSPVIGNGLGSVDALSASVQDFYYESKYVHNHYIQVLVEMGIPGLITFVGVLASAAWLLLRHRKDREDPIYPALCAGLAMMALHAFTEVDWSMGQYQILALLVLGMIAVRFPHPLPKADGKAGAWAATVSMGAGCGVFALLLAGNLYAENAYAEMQVGMREQTPYSMTELARLDAYNWSQYKLDMAVNAAQSPREEFSTLAAQYAEECRALRIYTINNSLETYVYLPMGRYEELFEASREGITQRASSPETWTAEFMLYESLFQLGNEAVWADAQWLADQVLETERMLADYNEGRMQQIVLPEAQQQFLRRVEQLMVSGLSGADARTLWEALLANNTGS